MVSWSRWTCGWALSLYPGPRRRAGGVWLWTCCGRLIRVGSPNASDRAGGGSSGAVGAAWPLATGWTCRRSGLGGVVARRVAAALRIWQDNQGCKAGLRRWADSVVFQPGGYAAPGGLSCLHFVSGPVCAVHADQDQWARGIVHVKLLSDLRAGSGPLDEARLASRYLGKYISKGVSGNGACRDCIGEESPRGSIRRRSSSRRGQRAGCRASGRDEDAKVCRRSSRAGSGMAASPVWASWDD